jgi:flavin-dependent dehydrogenase
VLDNKQGQSQEIRARVVVGADGRNSRIAAASGVRSNVKPNNRFCYYAYYVNFAFPSQMIWFNEPNWIYAFPNDDGVTVLCAYIHKRHLPDFKRDLKTSFRKLYEGLPNGPQFDGAEQITETRGMLEIPNISRRAGHPGLGLIGDAALAVDPMWGTGVSFALRSAEWLVDCTAPACSTVLGQSRSTRRSSSTRGSIAPDWAGTHFRSPITRRAADSIRLKNSFSWRRCTIR